MAGTGELKLRRKFKSSPTVARFLFPFGCRQESAGRVDVAVVASLHRSEEAGQSALAGIARLVTASRWAIFVTTRTGGVDSLSFERGARSISDGAAFALMRLWRRELLSDAEIPMSGIKSARTAATERNDRKIERGRCVIAVHCQR